MDGWIDGWMDGDDISHARECREDLRCVIRYTDR
jgi:hypothetical protein